MRQSVAAQPSSRLNGSFPHSQPSEIDSQRQAATGEDVERALPVRGGCSCFIHTGCLNGCTNLLSTNPVAQYR